MRALTYLERTQAILQRTDPKLDEAVHDMSWHERQVRQATAGATKDELTSIVAYLAAQWHGLANTQNDEALLAMHQIGAIVRRYEDAS